MPESTTLTDGPLLIQANKRTLHAMRILSVLQTAALAAVFYVGVFTPTQAFAQCDAGGSAEDCQSLPTDNGPYPRPAGGPDVMCDAFGCSSSWISSLPVMGVPIDPVDADVPFPDPDLPPDGSDDTPSN